MKTLLLCFAVWLAFVVQGRCDSGVVTRHVEVEPGVKLEVLDFGGAGLPMVFLHGSGCTAHIYDQFAPRFLPDHRVIAITRRGAGGSDIPKSGYSDERFGRDILAVISGLGIVRPVLVGHSMAGSEMSWLNTHFNGEFSGFVYLDAAGPLAFYSELSNDPGYFPFQMLAMRQKLDQLVPGTGELHPKHVAEEVLRDLPTFREQLALWLEQTKNFAEPTAEDLRLMPPYVRELALGIQRYPSLTGPILAIFPVPSGAAVEPLRIKDSPTKCSLNQIDAFEYGVPSAKVVRIPGATHFVFQSNEAEVFRQISEFVAGNSDGEKRK
jgi:pimeloyl-ACP methyl ester carboxylesterase